MSAIFTKAFFSIITEPRTDFSASRLCGGTLILSAMGDFDGLEVLHNFDLGDKGRMLKVWIIG